MAQPHSPYHPSAYTLALALGARGDHNAASATLSDLLTEQEKSEPPPEILLATIGALADYAGAVSLYSRQLTLQEELRGPASTWAVMYNLSEALLREGEMGQAELILRKLLPLLEGRERTEEMAGVFLQQEVGTKMLLMEVLADSGRDVEMKGLYRVAVGKVEGSGGDMRAEQMVAFGKVWERVKEGDKFV
jgi:hypothetical protein